MKWQFDQLQIGMSAKSTREISEELIKTFSEISGDMNPVHLNEEYAKTTLFKSRIAHGLLVASFISALIANELPGEGSIYLKQDLNFLKPVYIGDIIETAVTITELKTEKKIIKLQTKCSNQNGDEVIAGEAIIKLV